MGSAATDVNGVAKFDYTFDKAANYQVYIVFNETSTYYGKNTTNITTVVKIPTITEIIVDGDKITSILKDKDGNPLEDKEIIFTINSIVIIVK